jgi:hypothetical protein
MRDIRREIKNIIKTTAMLIALLVMTFGTVGTTYAGTARDNEEVKRPNIELKERIIHPVLVNVNDEKLILVAHEDLGLILDLDDLLGIEAD